MKRTWKIFKTGVDVISAVKVLSEQKYFDTEISGPFAIQSEKSRKIYTDYDSHASITVDEAVNPWNILVVDTEAEKKTQEIRDLLKNCSCSGFSWAKIDNMSIGEIWDYVVATVDAEKKYKLLKFYFENNIYRKKN